MYELFSRKNYKLKEAYQEVKSMTKGEKEVLEAFLIYEYKNKKESYCPLLGGEEI